MISPARRRIVFNAIKNAILKGSEVEYWALRMYEQQEAGVLTDEQVAELEVLIDEYYNPPEPVAVEGAETSAEAAEIAAEAAEGAEASVESEPALADMTKAELLSLASERGVEAYESWTKAEIIATIEGAE